MADPNDSRVPAALRRRFKERADMDEGDRVKARKEGKRLDQLATDRARAIIAEKERTKSRPSMKPKPPGMASTQRTDTAKAAEFIAERDRQRKLLAMEEFNRVKSIGETRRKTHERIR